MKILGIDYGRKHVGLAMTDEEGTMAFPFKTIRVVSRKQLLNDLEKTIEYEGVRHAVVGMPKTLRGEEGATAQEVQQFITDLEESSNVPVDSIDERLSTQEARRLGHREGDEHAVAAQVLLEAYITSSKNTHDT